MMLIFKKLTRGKWRIDRDSNPGDGHPPTHFPGVRLRPLGHRSVGGGLASDGRGLQARNAPKTVNHQVGGKSAGFFGLFFQFYPAELHRFRLCAQRAYHHRVEHQSDCHPHRYELDGYAPLHVVV